MSLYPQIYEYKRLHKEVYGFPLRVIPPLPHPRFASRKLRDFPQLSAHSIPSILTLITSISLTGRIPLFVCLQDIHLYRFPRSLGGSPSIAATSGSPHFGLDFACRPFGFILANDTLPVLFRSGIGLLLRLRHFKGQSYRVDLNHLDCATVRRTKGWGAVYTAPHPRLFLMVLAKF